MSYRSEILYKIKKYTKIDIQKFSVDKRSICDVIASVAKPNEEGIGSIEKCEVYFADCDGDGICNPIIEVSFSNGLTVDMNCSTGVATVR